jgi:mRNA interferase RelE/StbE
MLFNCEPLKAEGSYYRVRVNDYRIGFTEDEGVITFIRVLHRREMYRYFP